MADKHVKLEITSAVWIDGVMKTLGSIVTVPEDVAKNLLHRQRAVLATANAAEKTTDETGGADGGDDKATDPAADKPKGGKK